MTSPLVAGVDLAATTVALAAMIVLHALPTGLSPTHDPVSQYGITRYRRGYRVLTVALGVAGLSAAAAVAIAYPPRQRFTIVAMLVVFGLCRLAISWWPMDAPGQPRSSHGTTHVMLAFGAFGAVTVAATRMRETAPLPFNSGYHDAFDAAFWLLVIGLVGLFITRRLDARHRYFGAAERLIYAGIYVLLIATGVSTL
ncbi:DUF998 domain-containing protein [Leekyejoonella antrihumi]|uniref:DUF998 domain-containing protein n=1 Tax=Leekyejoonella antrihumi TaxID=1660198 RepID=A0A563DW98_9MICO|nr:DUF998 domain-containing protein [Leekyejoonella antrihumi]TWP34550.1 DUF998 domain-containing protein [Leekyejoonella antrihumi]